MLLTRTLASASSFYTMVEMAKANGENVYHYLTYLLEKLSNDRMIDDELELLAKLSKLRSNVVQTNQINPM